MNPEKKKKKYVQKTTSKVPINMFADMVDQGERDENEILIKVQT